MQNVGSNGAEDSIKETKSTDEGQTTTTLTSSSPAMEKDQLLAIQQNLTESSPSEDEVSEDEIDATPVLEAAKFLLPPNIEGMEAADLRTVDPETQARLEALLEAAGVTGLGKLSTPDGKAFADPEVLRRLTSSVSCALDEAAQALTRMRAEQQGQLIQQGENTNMRSLAEACSDGDIGTVRKLLDEGRSVHETTEEGESLLSLACSAGYYELAQVLLAMRANVEDRGIKGDCTPLMEAASGGHVDIVKLLITQGADVNAQSSAGNTPLHYAACGGYTDVVKVLIEASANVEEHNENGHTPLMEAASAGHVEVAKQLLKAGAGINTHSNEFKESALTLACYKGHLEMVKFLLEAGADQEHKTDEMHTALMEASMDGHVEVARLLLDSGAQVNMPADSFESPLTLAACGGHVELASLLIERGANLEEVNDEGYTPLMEAAREGHEEMVALLLAHGAKINAQTEETQETALTLACCGGFLEVADFLIKAGADIELGCSTPLMEAAQEGHLDLVRYLITLVECGAKVNAQTQTGDTALTYACENGHTDVAEILLQHGAELEHESEGGRTPLMKAARAGHLCSVQFLISKGADVNRQTTTNDHTVLSLACAGGHLSVVELLLNHGADPAHKLKDGSTMLIEAAKGGHTAVVNLMLDWPNTMMSANPEMQMPLDSVVVDLPRVPMQGLNNVVPPSDPDNIPNVKNAFVDTLQSDVNFLNPELIQQNLQKSLTWHKPKDNIDSQKLEDPLGEPEPDFGYEYEKGFTESGDMPLDLDIKTNEKCEKLEAFISSMMRKAEQLNTTREEQIHKKQQILEELQKVERELQEKAQAQLCQNLPPEEQAPPQPFQLQHLPFPQQFIGTTTPTPHFTFGQPVSLPDAGHIIVPGSSPESPQPSCKEFLPPDGEERLSSSDWSGSAGHSPETPPTTTSPSSGPTMGVPIQAREKKKAKRSIKFQQQQTQHQLQLNQQSQTSQANTNTTMTNTNGAMEATLPASAVSPPAPLPGTEPQSAEGVADATQPPEGPSKAAEQSSRASSEEVDMSNVVPLEAAAAAAAASANKNNPENVSSPQLSPLQKISRSAEKKMKLSNDVPVSSSQLTTVDAIVDESLEAAALAELQNLPLQTMLEQSVAAATSAAATLLDQQYQQLQQERQQLQANYNLQQHVQAELQQLKLQQEYQQLQQQLKAQQALAQQLDLQGKSKDKNAQINMKQPSLNQAHQLALQQLQVQQKLQQQVVASQALTAATVPNVAAATTTVTEQAQQYFKLQQDLQHQPQLSLPHIQQQMEQQLQHLHKQLTQQKQSNQQVTQQELLQQAQQLQQQLQQVQQLQELAQQQLGQQQRQLTNFHNNQGGQPVKKSKKKASVATETLGVPGTVAIQTQPSPPQPPLIGSSATNIVPNNVLNYVTAPLNQDTITPPSSTPLTPNPSPASPDASPPIYPALELDAQTETNHDTALTLACAGGHAELVNLLLSRGADIEHRDKKGFTPLILAATAGHADVVEILLDHGADIEAQSERTKDTPLSLACSGGRYEVVELLLARGANKEHRNVSDYTPLSLAASGGYVNIIKLLLTHGAEINSRTGSKLGISPLMLAAMNGHTQAVKLLLDMGSDINAQIETNRNTALTLACFQGRHEVVSLLVDRRANIEHRAKTGLTPLMEAASGGYVEVGRVLLDKGADVNAPPVPSSRDTALTIAADKGHYRFVELLLSRGAAVDVKNKKGNSPLWLACNGGHLDVVQLLVNAKADVDSQDNRKVSCLMAAFRKGHVKVVKWLVKHVMQFPSDNECMRFIATCTDKELLKKCHQCMEIIVSAKDRQAAEANKNATILLEELDLEKSREESKKAALARKRERRRRKKKEKQEKEKEKQGKGDDEKTPSPEPEEKSGKESGDSSNRSKGSIKEEEEDDDDDDDDDDDEEEAKGPPSATTTSTTGVVLSRVEKQGNNNKKSQSNQPTYSSNNNHVKKKEEQSMSEATNLNLNQATNSNSNKIAKSRRRRDRVERTENTSENSSYSCPATIVSPPTQSSSSVHNTGRRKTKEPSHSGMNDLDDFGVMPAKVKISPREKDKNQRNSSSKSSKSSSLDMFSVPISPGKAGGNGKSSITSPKRPQKKDEEWKEVTTRKSEFSRTKKVTVPLNAVSRVIGRAGCNINAIREASGAHIEMDKQKGQAERHITIKGSAEAMRQAQTLIMALIKDPDKQLDQLIPKSKQKQSSVTNTSSNTFVSNMWHNSMALGVPASTNTGTIFTAQSCIMSASQRPQSSSRSSGTNVVASSSSMVNGSPGVSNISQVPFANVVRNSCQQPVNGHGPQPPTVASLSNQQPNHSPSPKKSGKVDASSGQNPPNSSSQSNQNSMKSAVVVRQLFPESSSSQASATATKSTVTYSMASMTKSKMVCATTPTFVVKTEARVPVMASKVQPTSKGAPISTQQAVSKQEPQPLPIMSSSGRPVSAPIPSSQTPSSVTAVYSPFNNHFSRVAESVLSKKDESQDSRKNFASVAAAGVVSSANQVNQQAVLEALLTKAPGYKPMVNNPNTNHQSEPDLSKAPGYRNNHGPAPPGAPNGPLMDQTNFIHRLSVATNDLGGEADPSKAPGYKGISQPMFAMMGDDFSRNPGFKLNQMNQLNMSPRSGPGGSPRSMESGHSPPQLRNEYSTPNHPMTLPKIESTLNPNAPDFTSRSLHQQLYLHHQHQQRMLSNYQSMMQANHINPALLQASVGEFPPPGAPGMGSFGGAGMPLTNVAVNSPLPRQTSPMAPNNQQQVPPVSIAAKDDATAALSSEASPSSSSAPSPTDAMVTSGERRPLPIGSGRSQKKMQSFAVGEPAGGVWSSAFNNQNEWLSSASTPGLPNSTVITPNLGGDGEDRSIHPVIVSQLALAGFQHDHTVMDPQLERALQGQAVLLASGATTLPFANGLPAQVSVAAAAASAGLPPQLYSSSMMPAVSGDTPQGWPQHKQHISELCPDPKMWNNWSSPGSM